MNTATGVTLPATVLAGGRAQLSSDGLPIASVTGFTSAPGAGPGSKTSLGDSLPSIMAVGHLSATDGSGFQDRSSFVQYGRLLWWHSWVAVRASISPPALEWDGFRWLREKFISPDIV